MKIYTSKGLALLFLVFATCQIAAQEAEKKPITVQKYTIMDQFAPELVKPVSERMELKQERITHQRNTKIILDTLDISDRKRRRLLRELRRNPFSEHVDKVIMAETHFEDGEEGTKNPQ